MKEKIRVGYIIASSQIMRDRKAVGYLYRESVDNANDSGWRVFSGEETQAYADDASNFAIYNASTVVDAHPEIAQFLGEDPPVEVERDSATGQLRIVARDKTDQS